MIGLTGAHRTGKTTLAKDWSVKNDVEFLTLNTTDIIASMDLECKDISGIDQRIEVQKRLVEACDKTFQNKRTAFISDRTPLDVAAYMLADICGDTIMSDSQIDDVTNIVTDCIDITNVCFGGLIHIYPGIPYVSEPGKPLANAAYQYHHHTLVGGLLGDLRFHRPFWVYGDDFTDHEERMAETTSIYEELLEDSVSESGVVSIH